MQMKIGLLCLILAAGVGSADHHEGMLRSLLTKRTEDGPDIHPPLDPKSSKVFFKHDYPDNEQPPVTKDYKFDHPYPIVQTDHVYDTDYVKDENSDSGEWQAQMEYDTLRNKIRKMREGVDDHERWANEADKAKDEAEKAYNEAKEELDKASAASDKAKQDYDKADDKVHDLTGETYKESIEGGNEGGNATTGGEIGEAVDKVKYEMKEFEECKKKLAETRAKLKKLMDEHEDHLQAKSDAEAEKAAALEKEKSALSDHDKKMKKLYDEEEEAEEAKKSQAELESELKETEAAFDKAAAKLRKVRGEDGHSEKHKSAAAFPVPSVTVLLMVLATVACTWNFDSYA